MYHAKSPGDYTRDDMIRHTARMDLLTLNLRAPLSWNQAEAARAGIRLAADALASADAAPDSAEIVMTWDWDAVVDSTGDDGPRAKRPAPPPVTVAAKGLLTGGGTGNADEQLPAGRYLFVQLRPGDAEELADAVDSFAREAWWTRAAASGPLIVRFVREDGKTAAQLIRRLADTTASPMKLGLTPDAL